MATLVLVALALSQRLTELALALIRHSQLGLVLLGLAAAVAVKAARRPAARLKPMSRNEDAALRTPPGGAGR